MRFDGRYKIWLASILGVRPAQKKAKWSSRLKDLYLWTKSTRHYLRSAVLCDVWFMRFFFICVVSVIRWRPVTQKLRRPTVTDASNGVVTGQYQNVKPTKTALEASPYTSFAFRCTTKRLVDAKQGSLFCITYLNSTRKRHSVPSDEVEEFDLLF